jgi:hypothetical protein
VTLLAIVAMWLSLNVAFATLFMLTGGIVTRGPAVRGCVLSVQILGTIGYGAM